MIGLISGSCLCSSYSSEIHNSKCSWTKRELWWKHWFLLMIVFQTASTYNNFTFQFMKESQHFFAGNTWKYNFTSRTSDRLLHSHWLFPADVLQVYPRSPSRQILASCAHQWWRTAVSWCQLVMTCRQPWMNQTQLINQEVTYHKKIPDYFDFELSWTFQMILHCLRELVLERFLEAAPIGNQQGHLPEWNPSWH